MSEASGQIALRGGEYQTQVWHCMNHRKLRENKFSVCPTVWLITTGRSGTQWICNLLNQYEKFKAVHEPYPSLFEMNCDAAEGKPVTVEMVQAMRCELIRQSYQVARIYVDASPFLSHLVDQIRGAFVSSKFIHLSRDPRRFVCSAAPRDWYRFPHPQDHWWPKNHPEGLSNVERLIWWWNEVHKRGLEAEEKYGPNGVYRVRVEDLWADAEAVKLLLGWLKVDRLVLDRSDGVITSLQGRPKNESTIERAEWLPEWEEFLQETAGETMRELGYE